MLECVVHMCRCRPTCKACLQYIYMVLTKQLGMSMSKTGLVWMVDVLNNASYLHLWPDYTLCIRLVATISPAAVKGST